MAASSLPADGPRARRSQDQRSTLTRIEICEATIDCLNTVGYRGTTMTAVHERAGLSRGAITHHFASKHEMLIAAIDHLAARREGEFRQAAADLVPGQNRIAGVIALLWDIYRGNLFYASLELWTVARTDEPLRQVLVIAERELGRRHRLLVTDLFGPEIASRPGFDDAVEITFNLMRGMTITRILRHDPATDGRLVEQWARTFELMLGADC